MAEAQAYRHISVRNVHFLEVDDYGWTVNIRFQVPRLSVAGLVLRRWFRSLWAILFNIMYPIGLLFTSIFSLSLSLVIVYADEDSWMRQGKIAYFVWDFAECCFPFWSILPLYLRIGVLAAEVGIAAAFFVAVLNRFLLRLLLSWHGWMATTKNQAKITTMVWGGLVKMLSGRLAPTWLLSPPLLYSFSNLLPILPVPDLKATVEKYLLSIKGFLPTEKYEKTAAAANKFLTQEGPLLQRYLTFKWLISSNYISDWWEQYVYLNGRSSLMINSNYYFLDYPIVPSSNREARSAIVMREIILYKHKSDNQTLEPFLIRDTVPMCMEQHKRMFATTRVPGREEDKIKHLDAGKEGHVAVLHKGFYYKLNVYSSSVHSSKTLLSAKVLEHRLNAIKEDATKRYDAQKQEPKVASLTSLNRTRWAELREDYLGSGLNKVSLNVVESALFVLVLDDEVPTTNSEMGLSLLAGVGNRWYDKSLTLVAFKNGRIGANAEHTWADALVMAHMWECVVLNESSPDANKLGYEPSGVVKALGGDAAAVTRDEGYRPERLYWDIPANGTLYVAINNAADEADLAKKDLDLNVFDFDDWGKSRLKEFKLSPDGTIQMALQLAFYRDQNEKFGLTYEASMTRLFRQGRTETIRSLSVESVAFVKAMEDSKATREEKVKMLQSSVGVHTQISLDSRIGRGIDRHLFGLYVVSKGKGIESEFLSEALSAPWTLSTSQQPAMQTNLWNPDNHTEGRLSRGGGFGPVADDGYGVSYLLSGKDQVYFHISSKHTASNTKSKRFSDNIRQALNDIEALFPKPAKK